ncbi:hypothetical protein CSAL01_04397 [Colletotrichum salicis]|uniref:Uncharacterized protein n=1 Tax=Colletotrichum salicis TaxID=1209931 RepID=A0A135RRT4_9PEZI|nr:hypothetical protein CSAL01_04397 [Colletotrichum salicis]
MWTGRGIEKAIARQRQGRRGGHNTATAVDNTAMEVENTTTDVENITPGVKNLAITDAQRRCMLLTIPYEIRRKIYIEVVNGSEVTCAPYNRAVTRLIGRQRRGRGAAPLAFTATEEHSVFLLTCRQIYEEARSIYWAHSLVDAGKQHFRAVEKLFSSFAKQNAEHIQGVVGNVRFSLQPAGFLQSFPRAKTVRLSNPLVTHFAYETFASVVKDEESIVAHIKNRMEFKGLDKLIADVQFGKGVQFLVAAVLIGHPVKNDGTLGEDKTHKYKHCFYNMTTGKLFAIDFESIRGPISRRETDEDDINLGNFDHVLEGRYLRGNE